MKRRGFTLVELLLALIILGVLSGLAVTLVGSGRDSGQATRILSNLRAIKSACLIFYVEEGSYPGGTGFISISELGSYLSLNPGEIASSESDSGYYLYEEGVSGSSDGDRILRAFYRNVGSSGPLFQEGVVGRLCDMGSSCGLLSGNSPPEILEKGNIGSGSERSVTVIVSGKR